MRLTKLRITTLAVAVVIVALVAVAAYVRGPWSAPDPGGPSDDTGDTDETGRAADGPPPGARLYRDHGCSQCHSTTSDETTGAPGLKGILDRETLPMSGRPATRENVRRQLVDPYDAMPSYEDRLSDEEMERLVDYLATL